MERAELPTVLFNLVHNSIINVTFLRKLWTVCSAHFAACKSRKTGNWLSWLNSTNFPLRNAIKNYKYMQCYMEVTWYINVRIFLLVCYQEGNAVHPVGYDSPLQIKKAVWRIFFLGRVWQPAWRTLSRVEHVGNRKWPHLFEAEYGNGGTGHHGSMAHCEDGMEYLVTCWTRGKPEVTSPVWSRVW